MNRKIEREPANQPANADVLHDGGVNARRDDRAQVLFGFVEFVGKHERVERDIAFDAAPVQELDQSRQIGLCEIMGAQPRVELFEPEVNRVRAILDCGLGAFPIPSGREQFGKAEPGRWKAERIGRRLDVVLRGNRIVRTAVHQRTGS